MTRKPAFQRGLGDRAGALAFAASLGVAVLACGPSKKEEEAQRVASAQKALDEVAPKLAHLQEIKEDAAKRPVVMGNNLKLPKSGTAGFLYLDADDDPHVSSITACPDIATKEAKGVGSAIATLELCARADYAVVMHKRSLSAASVSPYNKTFNPGLYDGEAFVYELATGKYLGAFEVRALSSPSQAASGAGLDERLRRDLMTNAEKAASAIVAKAAPP